MVGIMVLIAIPFAIIGESVADNIDFIKIYRKIFGGRKQKEIK